MNSFERMPFYSTLACDCSDTVFKRGSDESLARQINPLEFDFVMTLTINYRILHSTIVGSMQQEWTDEVIAQSIAAQESAKKV